MIITSKTNNIVKYIDSLKSKKYRNKYNKYVIEGIKMVEEIINSEGSAPEFIVYSREILENVSIGGKILNHIENLNFPKGTSIVEVSKEVFKVISDTESPQGVLAVLDKNEMELKKLEDKLKNEKTEKYIILDKVQDPGNLGTIIRSCVGFNIKNIICIEGTVDAFSPKVTRSTMGGIRKVNIFTVKEDEIDEMINIFKENKYSIVTTALTSKKSVREETIDNKTIFVMGNEANGVSQKLFDSCDKKVKIPMEKELESFNVAVAASIVMYEQYIRGGKSAC